MNHFWAKGDVSDGAIMWYINGESGGEAVSERVMAIADRTTEGACEASVFVKWIAAGRLTCSIVCVVIDTKDHPCSQL
jgi:hypothetical protein